MADCSDMADPTEIQKMQKNLSKASDLKTDMLMTMSSYANWEELVQPAPVAIALLGQLVLLSSKADFKLDLSGKQEFNHLKYPDSFRACLFQVSNEGWRAFNKADKNMDRIRMYTATIPDDVKEVVKIMLQGSVEEARVLLPNTLERLEANSSECVALATEVEAHFEKVMTIIEELLEGCTQSKGQYEQKLTEIEHCLTAEKKAVESTEERNEAAQKYYEAMHEQVEMFREEYKTASDSLPTGLQMFGMGLAENATKAAVAATEMAIQVAGMKFLKTGQVLGVVASKAVSSVWSAIPGRQADSSSSVDPEKPESKGVDTQAIVHMKKIVSFTNDLQSIVSTIMQFPRDTKEVPSSLDPVFEGKVTLIKRELENEMAVVSGMPASLTKDKTLDIAKNGIELVNTSLEWISSPTSEKFKETESQVRNLTNKIYMLEMEMNSATGSLPFSGPSPKQDQKQGETSAQLAAKNARFKMEQANELLKKSLENYDIASKRVEENGRELQKRLQEMAKYDLQKVNFEQMKETLHKGLKDLSAVKKQWGKLVVFFQMIASSVKCALKVAVKDFSVKVEEAERLKFNLSDMMLDFIYHRAAHANKVAYVTSNLATTYTEISRKYLMDQINSLGELMALDSEKDQDVIRKKQTQLNERSEDTMREIGKLIERERIEFRQQFHHRMQIIETEMNTCLPPPEPGRSQQMKKLRQKADEELREYDVDQYA